MTTTDQATDVLVLGAGMVGTACALELQRRGLSVRLLDRRAPGQETSYGNAGVLTRSSLVVFNNPSLWSSLRTLVMGRSPSFRARPSQLLRHLPWSLRFLAHARQAPFQQTARALDALIRLSMSEHRRLLAEAGIAHRLRDSGWLLLYRSQAGHAGAALARATYADFGVAVDELDAAGIRALEPALAPLFVRGSWVRDAASVDDPGAVVSAYADLFTRRGGTLQRAEVATIARRGAAWQAQGPDGRTWTATRVVVALGPWSPVLMARLGLHVPMATERGYHMHYAHGHAEGQGARLQRPCVDAAGGYSISPMGGRLRLTTGVELAHRDAPPDTTQLQLAEAAARQALGDGLGPRLDPQPWLGRRPTLPDSRPMIGAVPGQPGLWCAFGHQHIGFNTGPGTAQLLGALVEGSTPPIDPAPFAPSRFL